jgi:hypothetical protein
MKPDNASNDNSCTGRLHIEDNPAGTRTFNRNSSASIVLAGAVTDDSLFFDFYESTDISRSAFQYSTNGTVTGSSAKDLSSETGGKDRFDIELVDVIKK